MAQTVYLYKGEGKRPYKVQVTPTDMPEYTRHVGSEKAAITMANNIARHSAAYGIDTDSENGIWEPCEERNLMGV